MVKRKISQQQSSPALPHRIFQQSRQHSSAESQRVIPIMKAQQTMIDVIKTPKTHGRSFTSAAKTSSINMTTMDTKQSESYLRNVKRTQLPTPAHPNLDFKSDLHSQQRLLWQQLQLLKLIKGLDKQVTLLYGFQMTEEEMFTRIHSVPSNNKISYAQLECVECLKLTNKMLREEITKLALARKEHSKAVKGSRVIEVTLEQAEELLQKNAGVFLNQQDGQTVFKLVFKEPVLMPEPAPKPIIVNKPKKVLQKEWERLTVVDGVHQSKEYGAAKIEAHQLPPFKHLKRHIVNQTIFKVNQLVLCLFKQKIKIEDLPLVQLLKHFNIQVPKQHGLHIDTAELKKPEFLYAANMKLMQRLFKVLNQDNGDVKPETGHQFFRAFIGTSNNHQTVRHVIKRRAWWHRERHERFIGCTLEDDTDDEETKGAHFIWTAWRKTEVSNALKKPCDKRRMYSKLEDNFHLANKKALFLNLKTYYEGLGVDPFEVAIPLTFHIKQQSDPEFLRFQEVYNRYAQEKSNLNIWIIKPGENSNRGSGIQVAQSLPEIKSIIRQFSQSNGNRTTIVQKYLEKPLLVSGRKVDLRAYAMLTSVNGVLKGYMYRDCYFRTSSKTFDLTNLASRYIHLTNDAVQMNSEDYGKFEAANKMSINDFQRYLDLTHPQKSICFMRDLFPVMERLVTDSVRAVHHLIDPNRLKNSFEVFGYDFMIDEDFRVYLIECNTNPCLEICCPLLARIIPELLDNSFKIALDPIYQPPAILLDEQDGDDKQRNRRKFDLLPQIKYSLIFDSVFDAKELTKQKPQNMQLMFEIQEEEKLGEIVAKREEVLDDEDF